MAWSLEQRVPLEDFRIAEFSYKVNPSFKMNGKNEKIILKDIGKDYLPKVITQRKKKGYGVPWAHWVTESMKEDVRPKKKIQRKTICNKYMANS